MFCFKFKFDDEVFEVVIVVLKCCGFIEFMFSGVVKEVGFFCVVLI